MENMNWEYARQVLNTTDASLAHPLEGTTEQIANVYRDRAKKLARPSDLAAPETSGVPVLVFRLNQERYGIALTDVSAVLGGLRSTPVPEAKPKLEGLINVSGTIRPLLNLRILLDLPAAAPNTQEFFLLLRQKQRELGVKVEEIERVCRLAPQDLEPTRGKPAPPCIRGFTRDTLAVLNTAALFSELWDETSES